MAKNKKKKEAPKPKRAGYQLCVWCKGGLDENKNPITAPWHLVYAPFWIDNHSKKPAAVGWDKSPVVFAVVNTIMDYDSAEDARDILATIPEDQLEMDADAFHRTQQEHYITT